MGLAAPCSQAVIALSWFQLVSLVVVLALLLALSVALAADDGAYRERRKIFAQAVENGLDPRWLLPLPQGDDGE